MLTSYTSSEEKKNFFLRKFAQNIRKSNEGLPLTNMRVDRCAICENIVQSFQTINSTQIPLPPRLFPNFSGRNSSTASAEEFCNRFYYSEGLKHKLRRVPLLGLPKYIY